jgi:hypothetical protein
MPNPMPALSFEVLLGQSHKLTLIFALDTVIIQENASFIFGFLATDTGSTHRESLIQAKAKPFETRYFH